MTKIDIAFIGGSGLYKIPEISEVKWVKVSTNFGQPSSEICTGRIGKCNVAFLPRHGKFHTISPSKINYRANIEALKKLGSENIISLSAVGSLRNDYIPGDFVLVDQFIDKTYLRKKTFFEDDLVVHLPMAQPVCKNIKNKLADSLKKLRINFHNQGTYVCIEGPQFSTLAESELFRSWGCDVIGMTNMPEAKLSLEAGICYASVGMVTDFDCWHPDHENVSVDQIVRTLNDNSEKAKKLISFIAQDHKLICSEKIKNLAKNSVITNIEKVQNSTKNKLKNILK
tara:strand:- start:105 stop:956 length:852 start_codon:yes stop_codon:yes gene_type:complete